jgi:hypothetical protein
MVSGRDGASTYHECLNARRITRLPWTRAGREGGSFHRLLFFCTCLADNYFHKCVLSKFPKTCYPPSLHRAGPYVARVSGHLEQGGKGGSRPPAPCQANQGNYLRVAPVQPDPQHLTLGPVCLASTTLAGRPVMLIVAEQPVGVPWQRCRLYPGRAYKKPPWYSGKVTFVECGKTVWGVPGAKTPATPNEPGAGQPDALDAGCMEEGTGVYAW